MKKAIYAAVAATIAAGSAVAHPGPEAHVCGIDPASVSEWPGYGTRDNIYDRGDYFFAVEVENFSPSISYKHWNKVEAITLHHRVNKETCAVSTIEIVHPESEPEIIPEPVVVTGGGSGDGDEEEVTYRLIETTDNAWVQIKYDEENDTVTASTVMDGRSVVITYSAGGEDGWWARGNNAQSVIDAFSGRYHWNGQNSAGDDVQTKARTKGQQRRWLKGVYNNDDSSKVVKIAGEGVNPDNTAWNDWSGFAQDAN